MAVHSHAYLRRAHMIQAHSHRTHDQVVVALADSACPFTLDNNAGRAGGGVNGHDVAQIQCDPETVKTRPQIGAGGRHADTSKIRTQLHDGLPHID